MHAISIRQPWAWAILHAGKDIENRTWPWRHRGLFAIHAPATLDPFDKHWPASVPRPDPAALPLRAFVGVVEIVDVVERSRSRWWQRGSLGWVLANPRPLARPIPYRKGNVSAWEVPSAIARAILQQLDSRLLTVTQANLNNNHLYLRKALDFFPDDVLGGSNAAQAAPRTIRIQCGKEVIETDIDKTKKLFRKRAWLKPFFQRNDIQAGDRVLLEQIEPYVYRISRV